MTSLVMVMYLVAGPFLGLVGALWYTWWIHPVWQQVAPMFGAPRIEPYVFTLGLILLSGIQGDAYRKRDDWTRAD